jgi:hypothetical protein
MKKKYLVQLTCLTLILFISDCSPIKFVDTIPSGSPKGYVEFYYLKKESLSRFAIYNLINDQKIFEGYPSFWDLKNKVGLRLAKTPGNYSFLVHLLSPEFDSSLFVQITKDTIAPVKIALANKWVSEGNMGLEKRVFYLDVRQEKAVPYLEYINQKGSPTGSAPPTTLVTLPPGSPKGYVEFYIQKDQASFFHPSIYRLVDSQEIYEGYTSSLNMEDYKVGLQLAKFPGTYTFSVNVSLTPSMNTYRYKIPVQIVENMITPVKITYPGVIKTPGGYMRITTDSTAIAFDMYVEVEKTIPYVESY